MLRVRSQKKKKKNSAIVRDYAKHSPPRQLSITIKSDDKNSILTKYGTNNYFGAIHFRNKSHQIFFKYFKNKLKEIMESTNSAT